MRSACTVNSVTRTPGNPHAATNSAPVGLSWRLNNSPRAVSTAAGLPVMDTGARRPVEAQKEFENLVASYPKTSNIHYLFGSFLMISDPDAGLKELKKELEIAPRSVPALLQIAFEYLRRGDAAMALSYARQASEIDPESFVAHNALGRALVDSGDLDGGIKELELSKKQAPGSPQTPGSDASSSARRTISRRPRPSLRAIATDSFTGPPTPR